MRMPVWVAATWIVALSAGVGCNDPPVAPEVLNGGGLRLTLPEGTETLPWIRVELWDDNVVPPPGCLSVAPLGVLVWSAQAAPDPLVCRRMEVTIWDFVGNEVLMVPDTTANKGVIGQFPWDGLDGDGNPVPSGYYPTFTRCLDIADFTFTGAYVNWESREDGACQWPLWIKEFEPAPSGRQLEFGPIRLDDLGTVFVNQIGELKGVQFLNPFLVRVHAPGMTTFEAEVTLVDGEYSTVTVSFTPI